MTLGHLPTLHIPAYFIPFKCCILRHCERSHLSADGNCGHLQFLRLSRCCEDRPRQPPFVHLCRRFSSLSHTKWKGSLGEWFLPVFIAAADWLPQAFS